MNDDMKRAEKLSEDVFLAPHTKRVPLILAAFEEVRKEDRERISKALDMLHRYAGIDGEHHKTWVLDQVVRVLAIENYDQWVADQKAGKHGPNTYAWDTGIAP